MTSETDKLFKQAEGLFQQRKLEEAARYYNEAAVLFRQEKQPMNAARAFAQSALCEKLLVGLEPLLEAASLSETAAQEALKAGNYAFARWQFREAALLYEREGDFEKYSTCFFESQDAFVRYLWYIFTTGKRQERFLEKPVRLSPWQRISALFQAFFGVVSRSLWGYGEKPFNTMIAGALVIVGCGAIYHLSGLTMVNGELQKISPFDALYMSGVTFSTLGYGDYVPTGWVKAISVFESLSGFLIVPLLIVALTRRYLRVYR